MRRCLLCTSRVSEDRNAFTSHLIICHNVNFCFSILFKLFQLDMDKTSLSLVEKNLDFIIQRRNVLFNIETYSSTKQENPMKINRVESKHPEEDENPVDPVDFVKVEVEDDFEESGKTNKAEHFDESEQVKTVEHTNQVDIKKEKIYTYSLKSLIESISRKPGISTEILPKEPGSGQPPAVRKNFGARYTAEERLFCVEHYKQCVQTGALQHWHKELAFLFTQRFPTTEAGASNIDSLL